MTFSIRDCKPFNLLPEAVLKQLELTQKVKIFPKDTFVFKEGQRSLDYLFLVVSGIAEIIKGNSGVVGLRREGEFFGETVILNGTRYPASVKAVEELSCLLVEKKVFEKQLESNTEFASFFSRILTDRLRELYEEMVLEQPGLGQNSEPFKKRVIDIMSSPVVTCPPDTSISNVARILSQQKISSIIVTGAQGKMLGIVRERDLITKVLALDCDTSAVTAADIMQKDPPTLAPDAFFYRALLTMLKSQGKYIVVMDGGRPIGLITIGDLTRARSTSSVSIVKEIEGAESVEQLVTTTELISKLIITMLGEKAPANQITEVLSELNDVLTRRILALGESNLDSLGYGNPPVNYCWLTLGSGGRKELTLSSDQDNAIIYAEPGKDREKATQEYFAALAKFVTEALDRCGVVKCPGNIMATNPDWCRSLPAWKAKVHDWTYSPNSDSSLQFCIFLDFRVVFGQEYLAKELREYTLRLFRVAPTILHAMAREDLTHRVPLSLFKQVITEKSKEHRDEVDLKKAACVHVVDCVRIFALREGINETNTLERLNKLVQIEGLAAEGAEYYESAMQSLMLFRIRENLRKYSAGYQPDNYLNPNNLSKRERSVLRESFLAIDRLQNFTGSVFHVEGI